MLSKQQIESKNKGQVVDYALDLQKQLEALNSGPMTSDVVKARLLDLKEKTIGINATRATRADELALEMKALDQNHEIAKKTLMFKYAEQDEAKIKEINKLYKDLEAKALETKGDLSFGLEKEENQINIKKAKLQEELDKVISKNEELISTSNEEVNKVKADNKAELEELAVKRTRELEEKAYEHTIAMRDKDSEFIGKLADELGLSLIPKNELETLKSEARESEEDIQNAIDVAVKEAEAKVHRSEGSKYSKLKSETDQQIAILENNIENLTSNNAELKERVKDQDAQIKEFPGKIKDAVQAAQSNVTVTQDANKK